MTDISGINGVSDDSTRHYTPTTEEVRNTFWLGQHSVSKTDWANSEAEFNKWLAEVKAQARNEERKEAVKLIGILLAEAGGEIVISQITQELTDVLGIEQERSVVDGTVTVRLIKGETE